MKPILITYDSTNLYLVQASCGWIMVDTGWAGRFAKLLHALRRYDIRADEIKYVMVTHFHPDHAGLVQDVKNLGAKLILHPCQLPFVGELKRFFKPHHQFREIEPANNLTLSSQESRIFFNEIGIQGEILPTPGHSDDSVSLVIDACCAFTGDLPSLSIADADPVVRESWMRIQQYGVRTIYPGHGSPFTL
jgi:glyoxylase-like metal-dependent hydrolase (beta-lactamase superfamily II)